MSAPLLVAEPNHAAPERLSNPRDKTHNAARQALRDSAMLLSIGLMVLSAWVFTQQGYLDSGDDLSYWLAVVGGSMMLLVFLYPLRKHVRAMRGLGGVKWWLWLHIGFGLFGPWLILVHSTFRIGSLNAGVAMYSMLIVVASGIVGRFLYVRVHRGLDGEATTLRELQSRAGFVESDARSRLHFAPQVQAMLQAFEERELASSANWLTHLRQVLFLPAQQLIHKHRCYRELDRSLAPLAERQQWAPADLHRRRRLSRKLVRKFLTAVVRVAQFTAYERIFALWHVGHLPFVVLLVLSAVVHVFAVHAY